MVNFFIKRVRPALIATLDTAAIIANCSAVIGLASAMHAPSFVPTVVGIAGVIAWVFVTFLPSRRKAHAHAREGRRPKMEGDLLLGASDYHRAQAAPQHLREQRHRL